MKTNTFQRRRQIVASKAIYMSCMYLYSGPPPLSGDDLPTGTLLAQFALVDLTHDGTLIYWQEQPRLTEISNVFILTAVTPFSSDPAFATGTIGYALLSNTTPPFNGTADTSHVGPDTQVIYASVGTEDGDGEILFDSLHTTAGNVVTLKKLQIMVT